MSGKTLLVVVLVGALVIVIGGRLILGESKTPEAPPSPATVQAQATAAVANAQSRVALAGTAWQVEPGTGAGGFVPIVPGNMPTLGFELEKYTGYGGCDWFQGVYYAQGDTLRMEAPAQTRGGCNAEPAAATQQATYQNILWNTTNYALENGKLILYTTGDQRLLAMVPLEPMPFEGTTWELSLIFSPNLSYWAPLIPGTKITAVFDGKTLKGNAGCNDYSADYIRDGSKMTLSNLNMTMKACATPEGVMDQERAYLDMLKNTGQIDQYPRSIQLEQRGGVPQLMYHAQGKPAQ